MKIYAVHIEVSLREIPPPPSLAIEDNPKPPSLTEGMAEGSPMREVGVIFDRLREAGAFPSRQSTDIFPYGQALPPDGHSLSETVRFAAGDYSDVSDLLKRFHELATSLERVG